MMTISVFVRALWQMFEGKCPGLFMVAHKLTSDKSGLEMIEYIVMAGLLVAAVVVTVAFFGDTIRNMFGAIAQAISGNSGAAATARQQAQTEAAAADTGAGQTYQSGWQDTQ